MPQVARLNPTALSEHTQLDMIVWLLTHVFFEEKFLTIFTILFGVSTILFLASKSEEEGIGLYKRRNLILLLIGAAHAYLLWSGDILVIYALSAFIIVYFRKFSARKLLVIGAALIMIRPLIQTFVVGPYAELVWTPTQEMISAEIETYQGGWSEQNSERVSSAAALHLFAYPLVYVWWTVGIMLWGMAAYKMGIISNERSKSYYWILMCTSLIAGFALVLSGVYYIEIHDWAREVSHIWRLFNYFGALLVATGYVSAVLLICKYFRDSFIVETLALIGRTALSNYLLQTVIATTIFFGHGFGLFGETSSLFQVGVVIGIWILQIALTRVWMGRYKFGPVEWLWRTLTYGERQPLKK